MRAKKYSLSGKAALSPHMSGRPLVISAARAAGVVFAVRHPRQTFRSEAA